MMIGDKLRSLRESKNMTLEEVSKKLNITKQTLFKYETGIITNIPLKRIEQLAKIYNVSPASITGWEDETEKTKPKEEINEEVKILAREANDLSQAQIDLLRSMIKEFKEGKRK